MDAYEWYVDNKKCVVCKKNPEYVLDDKSLVCEEHSICSKCKQNEAKIYVSSQNIVLCDACSKPSNKCCFKNNNVPCINEGEIQHQCGALFCKAHIKE